MPTLRTPTPSFRAPTRNPSSSLEQCQGFTSLCYGFRGPTRNDGGGCSESRRRAPSFRAPTRNPSSNLEQCQGFTSLCYGFRGPTRNDGGGCDISGILPQPHTVIPEEERRISGRKVPSFRAPTRNPSSSLE